MLYFQKFQKNVFSHPIYLLGDLFMLMPKQKKSLSFRLLVSIINLCFLSTCFTPTRSFSQTPADLGLPTPGSMVSLTSAYVPVMVKGLKVHPENPILFDFIVDTGNSGLSTEHSMLKSESEKLIKYFLASLTLPQEDLWVNLSPYEKDRIVPEQLGQTEMGRDMLAQDYVLKQLTASLIYPEKELGKEFWNKVYTKAQALYGSTEIPVNTFNKVWIVADKAKVYVRDNTAFVVGSHLKVMLEEDYLASQKHDKKVSDTFLSSQVIREIVLPELEKEVNEGKTFANLRQIFHSMILAAWYKKNLKQSLLNQVYSNKAKINGVDTQDKTIKEQIYQEYLKAYKKGVFNYIKDDINHGQKTSKKYFSGGVIGKFDLAQTTNTAELNQSRPVGDFALISVKAVKAATSDPAKKQPRKVFVTDDKKKAVFSINRRVIEITGKSPNISASFNGEPKSHGIRAGAANHAMTVEEIETSTPEELATKLNIALPDAMYFLALIRKYGAHAPLPKMGENNIPSALLDAQAQEQLLGVVSADTIMQDSLNLTVSSKARVRYMELKGGLGTSFQRLRTLTRLTGRTTLSDKGTDSFFEQVEIHGLDSQGNTKIFHENLSVAELRLLSYINQVKQGQLGAIEVEELVNKESLEPVRAFWDTIYLKDRIDDRIQPSAKRTYRRIFEQTKGLKLNPKFIIQGVLPVVDPQTGNVILDRSIWAPGGHGAFAVLTMEDNSKNTKDHSVNPVSVFTNGDGTNNKLPAEVVGFMIRKRIPVAMITTSKQIIDLKGGLVGLISSGNLPTSVQEKIKRGQALTTDDLKEAGTLSPYLLEIAQAKATSQVDMFQDMGITIGGKDQQLFNTNVHAQNHQVLDPFLKELREIIGDQKYFEIIAPDLIVNSKTKEVAGSPMKVLQIEGASGSALLALNRFIMTTTDPRIKDLKHKHGIERLVYFINFDPKLRPLVFTPEKFVWDHYLYASTDIFKVDPQKGELVFTPQEGRSTLPGLDLDPYYEELENVIGAFGKQLGVKGLDYLAIKGTVLIPNAILKGGVFIRNLSGQPIDLTALKDDFNFEGGRLVLENVSITIDPSGKVSKKPVSNVLQAMRDFETESADLETLQKAEAEISRILKDQFASGDITEVVYKNALANTYRNLYEWTMDADIQRIDPSIRQTNLEAIRQGRWDDIIEAYRQEVAFGTAGIRGKAALTLEDFRKFVAQGPSGNFLKGPNTINLFKLLKTTAGVIRYAKEKGLKRVVLGYDSRIGGEQFAQMIARLFIAQSTSDHEFKIFLFDEASPFPELSYGITTEEVNGEIGILLSASHNPADYNGFKITLGNGAQLNQTNKDLVVAAIGKVQNSEIVMANSLADAKSGQIVWLGGDKPLDGKEYYGFERIDMHSLHVAQVKKFILNSEAVAQHAKDVRIGFAAYNGAGFKAVPRLLSETGFTNVQVIGKLQKLDGTFPAWKFGEQPDPGDPISADIAAREFIEEHGQQDFDDLDILIGTDPDADRMGITVKVPEAQQHLFGKYRLLSANDAWTLLLWYRLMMKQQMGLLKDPSKHTVVFSHVTTDALEAVAHEFGIEPYGNMMDMTGKEPRGDYLNGRRVWTGFTYSAEALEEMEQVGRFVEGLFEESNGVSSQGHTKEKDGTFAAVLLAEIAAYAKSKNTTLFELLDQIYERIGHYATANKPLPRVGSFEKAAGISEKIKLIEKSQEWGRIANERAGTANPFIIAGREVIGAVEFKSGRIDKTHYKGVPDEGVRFFFKDETMNKGDHFTKSRNYISIRTSGTAQALRFYTQEFSKEITPERKYANYREAERVAIETQKQILKDTGLVKHLPAVQAQIDSFNAAMTATHAGKRDITSATIRDMVTRGEWKRTEVVRGKVEKKLTGGYYTIAEVTRIHNIPVKVRMGSLMIGDSLLEIVDDPVEFLNKVILKFEIYTLTKRSRARLDELKRLLAEIRRSADLENISSDQSTPKVVSESVVKVTKWQFVQYMQVLETAFKRIDQENKAEKLIGILIKEGILTKDGWFEESSESKIDSLKLPFQFENEADDIINQLKALFAQNKSFKGSSSHALPANAAMLANITLTSKDFEIEGVSSSEAREIFESLTEADFMFAGTVISKNVKRLKKPDQLLAYIPEKFRSRPYEYLRQYLVKVLTGEKSDLAQLTHQAIGAKVTPGGIDLNSQNMQIDVDGQKIDIHWDPAMVAQFRQGDFSGVRPVIYRITPIVDIMPILGLAPRREELAKV